MDDVRFDDLSRLLAQGAPRRRVLAGIAALALAALGAGRAVAQTCRAVGRTCSEDVHCCSGLCGAKDRTGRRRCQCVSVADCPAPRPCREAVCDAGTCSEVYDDGATCQASPCTEHAVCRQGICVGDPKDCSALDGPCTVGVCNPANGECEAANRSDGTVCASGADACTLPSTCQDGACVAGDPKDCSALDGSCSAGVCNPGTGECEAQPINEGAACAGDDPCFTYACRSGSGVAGAPVDCSHLNTTCRLGVCDPSSGACISQANATQVGQPCDDGNACTEGTVCQANGTCGGGTAVRCIDPPECQDFPALCDPSRGCLYSTGTDAVPCDAGAGLCLSGICHECRPAGTRICPKEVGWICCSAICGTDSLNPDCCICA